MMARSFVLADTDRLHAKIVGMSDRIRQLEDALSTLNTGSSEPHPLLTRDLLEIKSMIDLHSAVDRPPPDETQPDADDDASDVGGPSSLPTTGFNVPDHYVQDTTGRWHQVDACGEVCHCCGFA